MNFLIVRTFTPSKYRKKKNFTSDITYSAKCQLCEDPISSSWQFFFKFTPNYYRSIQTQYLKQLHTNSKILKSLSSKHKDLRRYKGKSMQARMGRISLEVRVYCLWQERNKRILPIEIRSLMMCLNILRQMLLLVLGIGKLGGVIHRLMHMKWGISGRILI